MSNISYHRPERPTSQALVFATILSAGVILSEPALAQSSGAFAPLETAVQMIVDFITGPFGRLLAIIAVIALGFLAFAGRLSWFTAGAVVLGIGLVFGASAVIAPLTYLALFALCSRDIRILDLAQVVGRRTPRTPNRLFWRTNSYGP